MVAAGGSVKVTERSAKLVMANERAISFFPLAIFDRPLSIRVQEPMR